MPIVSGSEVYETEFDLEAQSLPPELKRVYITSKQAPEAPTEAAGAFNSDVVYPTPDYINPPERAPRPVVEKPAPVVLFKTKTGVEITDQDIETGMQVMSAAGPATMAGVVSKTIDKGALAVAQAAEREGISAREITDKTGFFKGADNRWRYEIDDSVAKLNPNWADNPSPTQMQTGQKTVKLHEVLDHPELYKAYPKLKDYQVTYDNNFKGIAEFSGENIRLGRASFDDITPAYLDKSVLMHEIQHAIQNIEGFAKGGAPLKSIRGQYKLKYEEDVMKLKNPYNQLQTKKMYSTLTAEEEAKLDYMKHVIDRFAVYQKAGDDKAYESYRALAGEVESFNVQNRVNLTPEQRMKIQPIDTEDVARADQIVRHSATSTTPYKAEDGFLSYAKKPK